MGPRRRMGPRQETAGEEIFLPFLVSFPEIQLPLLLQHEGSSEDLTFICTPYLIIWSCDLRGFQIYRHKSFFLEINCAVKSAVRLRCVTSFPIALHSISLGVVFREKHFADNQRILLCC